MDLENRLDQVVDNRFLEISSIKKKELPFQLHWFYDNDYFSQELFGFTNVEVENVKSISKQAFALFEKATDHIIHNNHLDWLEIPTFFHDVIRQTWFNKQDHPFFIGRMDVNGGVTGMETKVIEFNADTCTTIPETIVWQKIQKQKLKSTKDQFNNLAEDVKNTLTNIKRKSAYDQPCLVATSFGYDEDVMNCHTIIDMARDVGYKALYSDLEHLTFSAKEGVFISFGEEYEPVDVLFKIVPWDWMYNEEPELAKLLSEIVLNKLCVVLNPPYTAIWQHKKFLAYITHYFPNEVIAETYLERTGLHKYVEKPVLGRLGENVSVVEYERISSQGDFAKQKKIFQKYYPLYQDNEKYYYQLGIFYTKEPSALNLRAEKNKIITDDCEFMSHFII